MFVPIGAPLGGFNYYKFIYALETATFIRLALSEKGLISPYSIVEYHTLLVTLKFMNGIAQNLFG